MPMPELDKWVDPANFTTFTQNYAQNMTVIKQFFDALELDLNNYKIAIGIVWNSNDTIWNEKDSGFYFIDADGIAKGYPSNYSRILHIKAGNIVGQLLIAQKTVAFRRFNPSESKDWVFLTFQNITSQFTVDPNVADFYASRDGSVVTLSFRFKPTAMGWASNLITAPTGLRPPKTIAFSTATDQTTGDVAINSKGYISTEGTVTVVTTGTLPSQPLVFSTTYIAAN